MRRARDFKLSGDKGLALEHLFDVLTARKMGKMWVPAHEEMMKEFIELCVEHRESRKCKEGLMCYRYLQASAGQEHPMGKIILHLIDLAQRKAAEARARTESSAALDSVEDLDLEEQSPEALLMGGVTSEGAKDRTERETLLPWLRHMLDTYRNVLETLRYMGALDTLYHSVAKRAMHFCKTYNRSGEFKKITVALRTHLKNFLQNFSAQLDGNRDERSRIITPDSVERQLDTRFYALETCAEMGLWSEGFRVVDDIKDIFNIMDRAQQNPKPVLLATYYEKLARIFWVSENHLYHAYAWWRFYQLSAAHNNKLTEEDKRNLASAVALAALAIPLASGDKGSSAGAHGGAGGAGGAAFSALDYVLEGGMPQVERDRKDFLSRLLRWNSAVTPTRETLLAELAAKGVLRIVRPQAAALLRVLEADFSPLTLVAQAQPLLEWLHSSTAPTLPSNIGTLGGASASKAHTLSQYALHVERLVVFRLVEQLTAVYTVVSLDKFRGLIAGLRMSFHDVEKLLVRAVRARQLALRIDHRGGEIQLGNEALETAGVRRQLSELSARLQLLMEAVYPGEDLGYNVPREKKEAVVAMARRFADAMPAAINQRKLLIKDLKEKKQRESTFRARTVSACVMCVVCVCVCRGGEGGGRGGVGKLQQRLAS